MQLSNRLLDIVQSIERLARIGHSKDMEYRIRTQPEEWACTSSAELFRMMIRPSAPYFGSVAIPASRSTSGLKPTRRGIPPHMTRMRAREWLTAPRAPENPSARPDLDAKPRFPSINLIRFNAAPEFLYVVETTGGRITRLRVDAHGSLSAARFLDRRLGGDWPGRTAFDAPGNLRSTIVHSASSLSARSQSVAGRNLNLVP